MKYITPEIEIVIYEDDDILTTSPGGDGLTDGGETEVEGGEWEWNY